MLLKIEIVRVPPDLSWVTVTDPGGRTVSVLVTDPELGDFIAHAAQEIFLITDGDPVK